MVIFPPTKLTREKYIIREAVIAASRIASTIFQANEEEGEYGLEDIEEIGNEILAILPFSQIKNLACFCNHVMDKCTVPKGMVKKTKE